MDTGQKVLWYVLGMLTGWIVLAIVVAVGGVAFSAVVGVLAVAWPVLVLGGIVGAIVFAYDHRKR